MRIWRNDKQEEVDEYEFNNWLVTVIDNSAKEFGLNTKVVESPPPTIQRVFWTQEKKDETHFVLKEITPVKDVYGSYIISYQFLYPIDERDVCYSIMYCQKCVNSLRESIRKLSRWYYFEEERYPKPAARKPQKRNDELDESGDS